MERDCHSPYPAVIDNIQWHIVLLNHCPSDVFPRSNLLSRYVSSHSSWDKTVTDALPRGNHEDAIRTRSRLGTPIATEVEIQHINLTLSFIPLTTAIRLQGWPTRNHSTPTALIVMPNLVVTPINGKTKSS